MLNDDYKDILRHLHEHGVKFLLVGAYAMGAHGYPRATGDVDIWVEASVENSRNVYQALLAFGAPVPQLTPEAFAQQDIVFQIGVPPRRIDLITHIDGVTFPQAYAAREEVNVDGLTLPVLSKADLIHNKESTGRAKDRLDAEELRKHT